MLLFLRKYFPALGLGQCGKNIILKNGGTPKSKFPKALHLFEIGNTFDDEVFVFLGSCVHDIASQIAKADVVQTADGLLLSLTCR